MDQTEHMYLRSAIEKLTLNDASVTVHADNWYENVLFFVILLFDFSLTSFVLRLGRTRLNT